MAEMLAGDNLSPGTKQGQLQGKREKELSYPPQLVSPRYRISKFSNKKIRGLLLH